jgi:transcriptional regulator with XRE-family HTH domain
VSIRKRVNRRFQIAGHYIRALREAAGMTQWQLAEAVGVSYISRIENGLARVPIRDYVLWARALHVEPQEFGRRLLGFYDPDYHASWYSGAQ